MHDPFKTGEAWEDGRSEATYRGDSHNSISNSERECFRSCPEEYQAVYLDRTMPPEETVALKIGAGLHHRVLLPQSECPYVTIPDELLKKNGARNTTSKAWAAFEEANPGKYLLKRSEVELLSTLQDRLYDHPVAGRLFGKAGYTELPLKAICPDTGKWLRCRIDFLTGDEDGRILVDLKTYGGDVGNLKRLSWHILDYGYARQLAFYKLVHRERMGCDARCCLVFLEKRPPHRVRVIELSDEWMEAAAVENRVTLAAMKEAFEMAEYKTPGIDDVICLERPRGAEYQSEYELEAA